MDKTLNKFQIPLLILIIFIAAILRIYKVTQVPPGLYMDEVAIGVDAASVLYTARDQYGNNLPLFFKSYGDYKLPVYIYSTSLAILLFGNTDFSVRFTSILFSILTIPMLFLLLKKILEMDHLENHKYIKYLPLTSAFLLAISNWHIHFSRAGFEAIPALFLYLLSIYLAMLGIKNKKYVIFSLMILCLTLYTYNSYRIIAPITFILYLHLWFTKKDYKKILLSFILFIFLILPVVSFSFTKEGTARLNQTSTFAKYENSSPIEKLYIYPSIYLKNYISYFSSPYYFVRGDDYGRHQVQGLSVLLKWQIPFLLIGGYLLFALKKTYLKKIVLFLLFVSPLAASFTLPSPHALRSLTLVIPLIIICAIGISRLFIIKNKLVLVIVSMVFIFAIYESSYYLHFYYLHYPKIDIIDWGGGNKQMADEAAKMKSYKHIVIDSKLGFADKYFMFYHPELEIQMADKNWIKPKEWGNDKVLFIRPYYGNNSSNIIKEIRLDNQNNDIFAQFFNL
jgi:hypothetical protein